MGRYTVRMCRSLLVLMLVVIPSVAARSAAAARSAVGAQSAVSAEGATPQAADERAIRAVVQKYVDARELRDPSAIQALFTADADQHTTAGEWRRGRPEVMRGSLASSTENPGTRTVTIETVRFVTPDVALADGRYEIATGISVRRMWTTVVLEREEGAWRITAIRNMAPTDAAAARPRP